jgi:hypothetical protein
MATDRRRTEDVGVQRWRERLLRRAGMERHVAAAVAADPRYDVHQLLDLLERGCPEPLALRIVAPDDGLPLAPARDARRA